MQVLFDCSINDYLAKDYGKDVCPPRPQRCLNSKCLIPIPPKKHGGYNRYSISGDYSSHIYIHRFYCPYCGMTFSYLPSFCIPYFQYTLHIIIDILLKSLKLGLSFSKILETLICIPHLRALSLSHISFYLRRFMKNISWIHLRIRSISSRILLPSLDFEQRKKARDTIDIIKDNFSIPTFSQRFFEHCHRSFLASFSN
ncbi:DUF6431 domain-containing protein [Alkaliphilus hydrothermalis]|uniref:DUF6431 domain-containing protein n=1 Tax=Alkaliphilus hydrothermalis TaxID=1482730 RepID=A0ABS2NTP3_9FIRM|nr:hypothetical protein [Alkaliphilus hydrothermalis]